MFNKLKQCKEKDNEIGCIMKELTAKSQNIAVLEKEKEKYGIQFAQANTKYFHSLEEIKLKDNLISEFQKKNIETEAKLKQQQNLYETVRSDRNQYSKNLTETNEEIFQIRRKYKIVNHQISQLREEIENKENQLNKEHTSHKQKDKTISANRKIIEKKNLLLKNEECDIQECKSGIGKIHELIRDIEKDKQTLKEQYDLVVAERDILGT